MKKNKDLNSFPMNISYFEIKEIDLLENTDFNTYPLMRWHIFLDNFFDRIGISILVSNGGFRSVKQLLDKFKKKIPHSEPKNKTKVLQIHLQVKYLLQG